ncbi:MAG: response regulator [Bacteroidota bacterium]
MINDIFLIDDDRLVNFLNQEIIKDAYPEKKVRSFENASEAIETLKQIVVKPSESLPQLILLDINMPVMDGWEFLDAFIQLPQNIIDNCKVVMHTSSIDPRDIEKAKSFSAVTDFITKPLNVQSLSKIFGSY